MRKISELFGKIDLDIQEIGSILQVVPHAVYLRHWQDRWGVVVEFSVGPQVYQVIGSHDSQSAFVKILMPGGQTGNYRDWILVTEYGSEILSWRRKIVISAMRHVLELWVANQQADAVR
jgi:hypothetical protein